MIRWRHPVRIVQPDISTRVLVGPLDMLKALEDIRTLDRSSAKEAHWACERAIRDPATGLEASRQAVVTAFVKSGISFV
jgi:hypothetical protein